MQPPCLSQAKTVDTLSGNKFDLGAPQAHDHD